MVWLGGWVPLVILGLVVGLFHKGDAETIPQISGPQPKDASGPPVIPSMVLKDRSGRRLDTATFVGHPLLILNFLAPWCEPCLKEIPTLLRLSKESGERITVLGVVEGPVKSNLLTRFEHKFKDRLSLVRDPTMAFSHALGVHSLPTSFLVDSHGHILSRVTGAVDWGDPQVRRYLNGFISSKAGF